MRLKLLVPACLSVLVVGAGSCTGESLDSGGGDLQALSGAAEGVRLNMIPRLPKQNPALLDSSSAEGLLPLRRDSQPFLDIRGVGDSGYTGNQSAQAPAAALGAALDRFNPNGLVYRGDVNVMNIESVVGERCGRYGSTFGFLTSPKAISQAFAKGFQLFSLSNNHTRDCNQTPEAGSVGDGGAGEITTARNMAALEQSLGLLWNGVVEKGPKKLVSVKVIQVEGRQIKVALASIDLGRGDCVRAVCYGDRARVASALRATEADLKIATFHSREWLRSLGAAENLAQLDKIMASSKLFIEEGGAHVVFGSGPHIAMPIRVLARAGGGSGVAFLSLGNFIHPLLSAQSPNLVGRVLFDEASGRIAQVQAVMVATNGPDARPIDFQPSSPFVSGVAWKTARDPSTGLSIGFVNLKK